MSYATVTSLKSRLEITDTSEDTYLQLLLDAATVAIDNLCNTKFTPTAVTDELYDGTGTRYLRLKHRPATSVSSVKIDDLSMDSAEYSVSEGAWLVIPEDYDQMNVRLYRGQQGEYCWPEGTNNIKVSYTYGSANVPDPVELACLMLAESYYRNPLGYTAEAQGPRNVTYGQMIVSPAIASLLAAYVQVEVLG